MAIMPTSRPRIPILIVAVFPSRSPRYSLGLIGLRSPGEALTALQAAFAIGALLAFAIVSRGDRLSGAA